jgi:putative endonuclease
MDNFSNDGGSRGAAAEQAAEQWLQQQGLRTVERNFRCRGGEIDLVMRDGESLVFVEVRLRTHRAFGGAAASVTRRKQQRLIQAARYFMACRPQWRQRPCRFDVIAIDDTGGSRWQWLRNAFDGAE